MARRRLLAALLAAIAIAGCEGSAAAQPSPARVDQAPPLALVSPSPSSIPPLAPTAAPSPADAGPRAAAAPTSTLAIAVGGRSPAGPITVDLYRRGVYAMQATWWWCTAATVEMMRNLVLRQADHAAADQQRYFDYMHARDAYAMPAREGVDLVGLQAGLRHFVAPRYTLSASPTYDAAVRRAVTRLRLTGLPVVLVVDRGRHVWLLTGFTATADPARSSGFRVVSVRIVGPLYGRQSLNGYDPPPDTRLSYDALRRFLLPYHFKFSPTPWDRRYVVYTA
ncbi:MAG: hypothetical protein ACXWOW_00540 [Candidatus Limnocylindrales bacterium]